MFFSCHGIILVNHFELGNTCTSCIPIDNRGARKTSTIGQQMFLFHHNKLIPLQLPSQKCSNYSFNLFGIPLMFRFSSFRTLPVPQYEKMSVEIIDDSIAVYFAGLDQSWYSKGINELKQRWTKCLSQTKE